jgi:hypothetical protein
MPVFAPRFVITVCVGGLRQRIASIHDGFDGTRFNQFADDNQGFGLFIG